MLLQKQFFIMYIYSFQIFGNHIRPGAHERDAITSYDDWCMQMSMNMNAIDAVQCHKTSATIEYIDTFNERQWQPE